MNRWQLWGAIALVGALLGGYVTGLYYRSEIASIKAANDKATIDAQAKVIEVQKAQEQKTAEVSHDYQIRIAALRKQYADWVHIDSKAHLPGNAVAAGGHNGSATGDPFHGNIQAASELMLQADLQTQQLIACQGWVRAQTGN